MYKLKPVFAEDAMPQTTCSMYKLKNVHEKKIANEFDRGLNDFKQLTDQEIEEILKKQLKVFNELEQLKSRLQNITFHCHAQEYNPITLKPSEKQSVASTAYNCEDTVIFANPDEPPYSLLALPVLWPTVSWDISYHVHSTITKDLKSLDKIKIFKNVSNKDKKRSVKVFVIWQYTNPSPKIMKSPTDVVIGEVSFLKLFNKYLANETVINVDQNNSDKVLDVISAISSSKDDRTSELLNLINNSTIMDVINVAIWSLLFKQNKSPPKIEKWIERLTKMIIS